MIAVAASPEAREAHREVRLISADGGREGQVRREGLAEGRRRSARTAAAIEAAAASLIGPNDTVLNLASGVYGKGFGYWSARYHKDMVEIEVPFNESIDPASVEAAFKQRPDIKIVSLVHHDTPSGTINPIREIGRIVRDHGALLLVDAV